MLTLEDGMLAGSVLTMDAAVAYTVANLGIPLDEALQMGSLYPAQFLRLDRTRGRIAPGYRADLVHLDAKLAAQRNWQSGCPLFYVKCTFYNPGVSPWGAADEPA